MAESVIKDYFPSQTVSDAEKASAEYGLQVGEAIQREWFNSSGGANKFAANKVQYHKLKSYARGEQSIQKYKDELSINGDLSYLNLDWKPVPIIPKFVDIVVNGISERTYDIKAYSQDPMGVEKRSKYMKDIMTDMASKDFNEQVEQNFGITVKRSNLQELPQSKEELDLHMQLTYKQEIEIAEEQALNVLMEGNRYELIKKQFYYDLTVLGIGATKTCYNTSEGVTIEYVDPAKLVYSYTDSPYFEDIYYVGEVKTIPVSELIKQFPDLTHEELEDIISSKSYQNSNREGGYGAGTEFDPNKIQVLYFN